MEKPSKISIKREKTAKNVEEPVTSRQKYRENRQKYRKSSKNIKNVEKP